MSVEINSGETYSFKLNSGEELIAKVIEVKDNYVIITTPVSVAPGPQGMGLIPSLFTNDQRGNVRLNTNSISLVAETEEAVKMKYIEATTGISVPSKKMILG
jgi:hypothetical protein